MSTYVGGGGGKCPLNAGLRRSGWEHTYRNLLLTEDTPCCSHSTHEYSFQIFHRFIKICVAKPSLPAPVDFLSVCMCVRACVRTCVCVCVRTYVRVGACVCACIPVTNALLTRAWEGRSVVLAAAATLP